MPMIRDILFFNNKPRSIFSPLVWTSFSGLLWWIWHQGLAWFFWRIIFSLLLLGVAHIGGMSSIEARVVSFVAFCTGSTVVTSLAMVSIVWWARPGKSGISYGEGSEMRKVESSLREASQKEHGNRMDRDQ
ncbi:hypothetical protein BGZ63DRAFT_397646 [Mariannaea sp. PMI_226]|nr:hypothetical protein BGZ63DRAFT_397646 [Mariannaea sp. PMI_226]